MSILRTAALTATLLAAACATAPEAPRPVEDDALVISSAAPDAVLTRIAVGSCLRQKEPAPILRTMVARRPDLTLLIGDNVYGDVEDLNDPAMPELQEAYAALAEHEDFRALASASPIMATWDDHDYGDNDAGGDFPLKEEAEAIFENFWQLPPDDPRRRRPGIYTAETYGPEGHRVQIIMLDTRFFRGPLQRAEDGQLPDGWGRYVPRQDDDAQMLGEEQEEWLKAVLKEPADIRILVSSIQVIAEGHGWEAWRTMPAARERLYKIIDKSGVKNLVVASGDRHLGGVYLDQLNTAKPLFELTASSLNAPQSVRRDEDSRVEPGPKRLGAPVYEENFGEVQIDWDRGFIDLVVIDRSGKTIRQARRPILR